MNNSANSSTIPESAIPSGQEAAIQPTRKKISWSFILTMLLGGLAGFGAMQLFFFFAPNTIPKRTAMETIPAWLDLSVIVTLAFLGIFVAIAFHEWGHVIGAKLAGFRFYLFVVGPLRISKMGTNLEFSLNKEASLYGGVAASIPPEGTKDIRGGMMKMILGGPLASVILGVVFIGLAFALKVPLKPLQHWGLWAFFLLAFTGATSLMLAIVTGIPMRGNGFFSDGARVRMLLRNDAVAERYAAGAALVGMSLSDKPFGSISEELIEKTLSPSDGTLDDISAHVTAYYWHLDNDLWDKAASHLDYIAERKDGYPEAFQPMLTVEIAFFEAFHRNNAAKAEEWLKITSQSPFVKSYTRKRAETAIALAQKASSKAESLLQEIQQELDKETAKNSGVLLEKKLLAMLNQRLDTA